MLLSMAAQQAAAGLMFNTTIGGGLTALAGSNAALAAKVQAGFAQAQATWSSLVADDITVNITLDWAALGAGTLASASSNEQPFPYAATLGALTADRTSANDFTAVANLPAGPISGYVIDRAGVRYLNNGNATVNNVLYYTTANAKALGLWAPHHTDSDATITFSSNFASSFDFTHTAVPGFHDFVGIALHEIGHALGFTSGVDGVDFVSGNGPGILLDLNGDLPGLGTGEELPVFSVIDMFRHSAASNAIGSTTLELAPGGAAFFSIDGGVTQQALFSNGVYNGDGRQASHWKSGVQAVMRPALGTGIVQEITPQDLVAFDVIGYQIVPEPSSITLAALAAVVVVVVFRRRRA